MNWQPLFDPLKREHSGETLHEGVPPHLRNRLLSWISRRLGSSYRAANLSRIEVELRMPMDFTLGEDSAWDSLKRHMDNDPNRMLEVINFLLAQEPTHEDVMAGVGDVVFLEHSLSTGGSAWRATGEGGTPHLERRVPEEVQKRYDEVSRTGRSGDHLRLAWQAMYRQNPSPTEAYDHAVKAVEVAGRPVISPTNDKSTLGTMIRDFNAKPEKWDVPLAGDPNQGRDALRTMMQGVWHGHLRHGDETKPVEVSAHEAEAALHTALTLVHLFSAGLVTRST